MRAIAVFGGIVMVFIGIVVVPRLFSTWYSSNYTEAGFERVTVGMSEQQVEGILGTPYFSLISLYDDRAPEWAIYSVFPTERSFAIAYHYRAICVSNGVVVAKAKRIRLR